MAHRLAMAMGRVPMCACFAQVGALKDVACHGPPLAKVSHSLTSLTMVDEGSIRSLVVIVRDYRSHVARHLAGSGAAQEDPTKWLQTLRYEYFSLLDFYDRFRGRK